MWSKSLYFSLVYKVARMKKMKHIQFNLILALIIGFASPLLSLSQSQIADDLHFEVNRNYPPLSINKENLVKAKSLIDLNPRYDSSWVKEYISVEIKAFRGGVHMNALSKDDILSDDQKYIMKMADPGTAISLKVIYMPENKLSNNVSKEMQFTFILQPDKEASYLEGQEGLRKYIQENAIAHIPDGIFGTYDLVAILFVVDEQGRVIDPRVHASSQDNATDELLLNVIANMPNWTPAQYSNGKKTTQEFALTIGNMENCMINTLNINNRLITGFDNE